MSTIEIAVDDSYGSAVILSVTGEIEGSGARILRDRAYELIEGGRGRMIIDLTAVSTMDWTVLGVLIGLGAKLQDDRGRLAVISDVSEPGNMLAVSGVDSPFTVVATIQEGLETVGALAD